MTNELSVSVVGAERLRKLAALIKHVGDDELRKAMLRGLRASAKPLAKAAEDAARAKLPKAGGLNEFVASSKFAVRTRATPKGASIKVAATKRGHDLVSMNQGVVRHPVFGHMQVWVGQSIAGGWWDEALAAHADEVRDDLTDVLSEVLADLAAKTDRST